MDPLVNDSLLTLPDEVIEYIMSFLSFADLSKLSEGEKRLEDCAKRVSKMKPFHITVIGRYTNLNDGINLWHPPHIGEHNLRRFITLYDVKVISIVNDSVSYSDKVIPSLPNDLLVVRGARLSNGDLICECYRGGYPESYPVKVILEYWRLKDGSNQWKNVGKCQDVETRWNSTFLINGCFISTDNLCSSSDSFSHHELFINEYVDQVKQSVSTFMPRTRTITKENKEHLVNYGHTAALFGQNRMFICGGFNENCGSQANLSQKTFIYDFKEDRKKVKKISRISKRLKISNKTSRSSWIEGPPLITARAYHSSCVIQLDDKSVHCIVIGGTTEHEGHYSKSSEIFNFNDQKWVQGPTLPCGISSSACVAAPRLSNFACVLVCGDTEDFLYSGYRDISQNVFGLSKNLSEWKLLGKTKEIFSRHFNILLPLDYTI